MLGWIKRMKKRRNKIKRKQKLFDEQFGPRADFARGFPCIIEGCGTWPTQAAHVKSRGAGGKAESNIVSLCLHHHMEQHQMGILSFQAKYQIDLKSHAERIEQLYQKHGGDGGVDLPF
tara:strand:- start:7285 stop:7638 length:354 start_codon:yes stop_codon:yes gene_type:complete